MAKPWSEQDINYLKSMAGKMDVEAIANHLNRSVTAVTTKASLEKVSLVTESPSWSDSEIETLTKLAGKYSAEYIGKHIGKSANAVRVQASKIKVVLKRSPWSKDEVELLEVWAGEKPAEWIALKLNRSCFCVRQKAYRLGIDLALDLDNYSAKAIAELLQICRNSVSKWVREGKLKATRTSETSQGVYRISRKSFKQFYRQYKNEIPTLQKIDPERLEYLING